jgi:gliding motility-associated-like protein
MKSATVNSEFTIVAVEDDTEIEIRPTATSLNGGRVANTTFTISQKLNKGDVYQYQAPNDVSGSLIKTLGSCKPIAVFSGNTWASFCEMGSPQNNPSGGDNLFQQLFPVSAWGKNFVTAPFYNTENGNTDIVRIIVSEDNTNISVNGSFTSTGTTTLANPYSKGSIITYFAKLPSVIRADKPIGVAQYQTSQNCNSSNTGSVPFPGDPEMTILNPIEQTLSDITVFSKLNSVSGVNTNIQKYFLNLIVKTADAPSLKVDGNPVTSVKPIDSEYSYSILDVSNQADQHTITASGGFVAIAYGYGSFESYAYLAGADVKNLFQNISASTKSAQDLTTGCVNEQTGFVLKLPYQTSSIIWNVNAAGTSYVENNPKFTTTTIDGKTIYVYKYPLVDQIFDKAGKFTIAATVLNPDPSGCNASEVVSLDFEIFDPPTSTFTAISQTCVNVTISFKDTSVGNGKTIKKWLWDFGDGTTSTEQDPEHVFTAGGKFKVRLIVTGETGCSSSVFTQEILVNQLPVANFNFSLPHCANKLIVFTDASTSAEGKIVKWIWDPGDGSVPAELTTNSPFNYQYTATGTYKVSLKVVTEYGCESLFLEKSLLINPTPIVNFVVPEVCINDQFAFFTTNSSIADGSPLTYLWDFGDNLANVANPNTSTARNPSHRYTKAGNYQVTLTVKSAAGCESSLTQSFTVNGATPVASFAILKPLELCSNKEVVFTNTSTVDFGTLSKVEWYFDYQNSPTVKIVDEDPLPGKQYRFQYPIFTSPATRSVTVRMLAFSGGTCADEEVQTLTLLAAPKVSFISLNNVCMEVSPYQITQAREANGQDGTGRYYGKGISITGLFNPAMAGIGVHTIKYVFSALNGCADSLSQDIIVMPTPTVNAGKDTLLLEGTWIQLKSTSAGSNLSYKWFPATGLSRDDISDPMASPSDDVVYTLTVTSDQGCIATDQVVIKVLKMPEVPNTFTPNGDGINDVWNIKNLSNYPNPTIQIFNRYGDRLFSSFSADEITWDGKFQGTDAPVGTYYYIIRPGSGRGAISGSVTILR